MRVARMAGTVQASAATPAKANAVTAKVSGSAAETSKSRLAMARLDCPRAEQAERDAAACPRHASPEHQPNDRGSSGADGHPHADFLRPLADAHRR